MGLCALPTRLDDAADATQASAEYNLCREHSVLGRQASRAFIGYDPSVSWTVPSGDPFSERLLPLHIWCLLPDRAGSEAGGRA
jgi:hypothetical protein